MQNHSESIVSIHVNILLLQNIFDFLFFQLVLPSGFENFILVVLLLPIFILLLAHCLNSLLNIGFLQLILFLLSQVVVLLFLHYLFLKLLSLLILIMLLLKLLEYYRFVCFFGSKRNTSTHCRSPRLSRLDSSKPSLLDLLVQNILHQCLTLCLLHLLQLLELTRFIHECVEFVDISLVHIFLILQFLLETCPGFGHRIFEHLFVGLS